MQSRISSVEHYENFPVASVLVPKKLRPAIVAVYWFARSADDIADEGHAAPEERLAQLQLYRAQLERIAAGLPPCPELPGDLQAGFLRLGAVIKGFELPLAPFYHLLSAFQQDANFSPLPDEPALLDYCRRSANPVGRLVLAIFGVAREEYLASSDAICTSLQLINFLQDIGPDARRSRVYIPADRLASSGLDAAAWLQGWQTAHPPPWAGRARELVKHEFDRAQNLLLQGKALPGQLRGESAGRLRLELRATIAGGQVILDKIKRQSYDPFAARPRLGRRDWIRIMLTTLMPDA